MISRQFLKSSFIYTLVGALPFASGFLLLPWFTEKLTPAQFGINALYISVMYLIQIVVTFGLDLSSVVMQYDYRHDRRKMKQFLGTVFMLLMASGLFAFLFFSLGGFRLMISIFDSGNHLELLPFGIITIISAIFNSIFKTYSALLIYQEKPERFFWLNISNFIITIGASLLILYIFPYTLYGPIVGRLIPAIISAGISMALLSRDFGMAFDKMLVKPLLRLSIPLFAYAILVWVISYIDRFIILGVLKDPVLVGIFDFGVKVVLFLDLMMTGLVNTINPKVYSVWQRDKIKESTPEVNRFYHGLTGFFLLIIPLFVVIAPLVIPLFIHKEIYFRSFGFLAILSAGFVTRIWFFMFLAPIMFFKKTAVLPRVFFFSAIFEVGCALILTHYFGLTGAVWTFFLVKPVQAFLLFIESRRIFRFSFNKIKIVVLPVLYLLTVILTEILLPLSAQLYGRLFQVLVSVTLVFIGYRKEIIPILKERRFR